MVLLLACAVAWVASDSSQLRLLRIAPDGMWIATLLRGRVQVVVERLPPHTRNVRVVVGERTLDPGVHWDALPRDEARAETPSRAVRDLSVPPPGRPGLWRRLGFTRGYAVGRSGTHTHLLTAPFWVVLATVALPGVPVVWGLVRARRRAAVGCCPGCGYDLRATPDRCPECGAAPVVAGGGWGPALR